MTLKADLQAAAQVEQLQTANARLLRQLADAKAKRDELVGAVYQAARDAALSLKLPPVKPPKADVRRLSPETAVATLADWQLAKKTPSYNTDVCEQRIEVYGDRVLKLAAIQRADHPVNSLRVYMLGDLVEGELIFPGQAHRIDASLFRQVMVDGPRILGHFIRRMAAHFAQVHVEGVIGNHGSLGGRARKDYHPESNADAMLYEATRLALGRQPNVTWGPTSVPGERRWYAIDKIGPAAAFFLWHGDQVKGGFAGYPWYGFAKKLLRWQATLPEWFNYSVSGHFHTAVSFPVGRVEHYGAGSTESDNTWVQEEIGEQSRPTQWLLFVEPSRVGVTAEYRVRL